MWGTLWRRLVGVLPASSILTLRRLVVDMHNPFQSSMDFCGDLTFLAVLESSYS